MRDMPIADEVEIDGYTLELTCGACPEQYDVFKGPIPAGYLRLRHGEFRADVPDCGGEAVFEAEPEGDGVFEDHERERFLRLAIKAIDAWWRKQFALPTKEPPAGATEEMIEAGGEAIYRRVPLPMRECRDLAQLVWLEMSRASPAPPPDRGDIYRAGT